LLWLGVGNAALVARLAIDCTARGLLVAQRRRARRRSCCLVLCAPGDSGVPRDADTFQKREPRVPTTCTLRLTAGSRRCSGDACPGQTGCSPHSPPRGRASRADALLFQHTGRHVQVVSSSPVTAFLIDDRLLPSTARPGRRSSLPLTARTRILRHGERVSLRRGEWTIVEPDRPSQTGPGTKLATTDDIPFDYRTLPSGRQGRGGVSSSTTRS